MNYSAYSASRRKKIEAGLRTFFNARQKEAISIRFHADVLDKLLTFSLKGKLMRGVFVHATYEMCQGRQTNRALKLACALEIMHTGLLIHDDIMDQDELRRGIRTIYKQYADEAIHHKFNNPTRYGESMGISTGDVAFFLAQNLLTHSITGLPQSRKIQDTFSREMIRLGVAQMEDVYMGNLKTSPHVNEVILMYLYKSARYSFSLPFEMGAQLAKATPAVCKLLSRLGEQIGIIFQLKDDEIGLFETSKSIGKSIGIDIISNKKTLHRLFCLSAAPPAERKKLISIFGNSQASAREIKYVMDAMIKYNIKEKVARFMEPYEKEAYRLIDQLEKKGMNTTMLRGIVELNMRRTK
jgi:geranylgeranyl diphosphate synthase type I